MRGLRFLVLMGSAALLGACTSNRLVQAGVDAYMLGDYEGAAKELRAVEHEQVRLSDKGVVRYLVYRGLAAWHLGKKAEAVAFLKKGREELREGDPNWLPHDVIREMEDVLLQAGALMAPARGTK
jgi:hypothetical protein